MERYSTSIRRVGLRPTRVSRTRFQMKTGKKLFRPKIRLRIDLIEVGSGIEWDVFGPIPSKFLEKEKEWNKVTKALKEHFVKVEKGLSIIDLAGLPEAKAQRIRLPAEKLAKRDW